MERNITEPLYDLSQRDQIQQIKQDPKRNLEALHTKSARSDHIWLAVTLKVRPVKYEENHCRTDPDRPTWSLSLLSKT